MRTRRSARRVQTCCMSSIEARLAELKLSIPELAPAAGNYLPFRIGGGLVFTSGSLPMVDGQLVSTGKVGVEVDLEGAQRAARVCALNNLAALKSACEGDWERIEQLVMVTGYVNAAEDFYDAPKVINGASDLFVAVLGERGKHARAAVGVAVLPLNASVEVSLVAAIRN